jgi:hypothetical protein
LRLATLLHKRIFTDLLSSSPQSNLALDSFSIQSSALLLASDELISTMYTPQDSSAAANESASFLDVIKTLQADLDVFFSQNHILEAQLDNMSLSTNSSGEEMRTKKWFDTCFQQIHKAVGSLSSV